MISQDTLKLPVNDVNVKLGDNWFLDEQVKRDKDNPQQGYVRAFPESDVWEDTRGEDSIWTWEGLPNGDSIWTWEGLPNFPTKT